MKRVLLYMWSCEKDSAIIIIVQSHARAETQLPRPWELSARDAWTSWSTTSWYAAPISLQVKGGFWGGVVGARTWRPSPTMGSFPSIWTSQSIYVWNTSWDTEQTPWLRISCKHWILKYFRSIRTVRQKVLMWKPLNRWCQFPVFAKVQWWSLLECWFPHMGCNLKGKAGAYSSWFSWSTR